MFFSRPSIVSLIAFTAMALLAFFEFFVYRDTWMKYEYEVDKDFSRYIEMLILFHHDKILFKPELCFTASTLSWNLTILFLFIYSKLRINIDITVAMKCQRKYSTLSHIIYWNHS